MSPKDFDKQIGRTLLIGSPGGGKSTLCEYLAYSRAASDSDVAFLLPLRDLVLSSGLTPRITALIELELEAALQADPPQGFVERLLLNSSPLIIFDGLDEASSSREASRFPAILDAFIAQYPNVRILLTSRPMVFQWLGHGLAGFSRFLLEEFNDQQTATFVRGWFASAGEQYGRDRGEEFLRQITMSSLIKPNPLQLTLACSLTTNQAESELVNVRLVESLLAFSGAESKSALESFSETSIGVDNSDRPLRSSNDLLPNATSVAGEILQQFQHADTQSQDAREAAHHRPLQIRHIEQALREEFGQLLDVSDVESHSDWETILLSRALAALVIQQYLGRKSEVAAAQVVDGRGDCGIDALAVSDDRPEIIVVQSKWGRFRSGGFNLADVLKLEYALNRLISSDYSFLSPKIQDADKLEAALASPDCTIRLVLAAPGESALHPGAEAALHRMARDFNALGDILTYDLWDARTIWQVVLNRRRTEITISARMADYIHAAEPVEAYLGTLAVADVAEWYRGYRDRLFPEDISATLDRDHIRRLTEAIIAHPEHFWYSNNGITILCEDVRRHWSPGPRGRFGLELTGACVINGAQTVTAIHAAMQLSPGAASKAYVPIKIITAKDAPSDFEDILAAYV
ncbi:AIPR family protein [Nonomuraea aurantiaca]|uniref:AIPR family protein n=1 Tax=Nonomuraea aurantiaca TaxID=2878562 RepID=UPI001CDA0207|nr:AIPR family protein [Nonomuraea aurantiaca]MCA2229947.1 AIPR family protein [Nonomuraea aurantiaca]